MIPTRRWVSRTIAGLACIYMFFTQAGPVVAADDEFVEALEWRFFGHFAAGALMRFDDLRAEGSVPDDELQAIVDEHIKRINNWARARGVSHVAAPGL